VRTTRWATGVVVGATVLAVGGCGGSGGGLERLDTDVEFVGVVDPDWHDEAMVDASVRLASQMVALGEGENVVVSPLSLQLALAMLREGATGTAADEIDAVAGLSGDSQMVADLRAMLARFEGDVSGIDPDNPPEEPLVHIADSVFVRPDLAVKEDFLQRVGAYHQAEVFEADFASGSGQPLLDGWVKEETGGLIEKAPAVCTPETQMVLMDAVTFGATWSSQFVADDTFDDVFTLANGSDVQVPMMHQTLNAAYAEGDGWVTVELPYTDGFAMRIVLPDDGEVSQEQWAAAHDSLVGAGVREVELTMPKWEFDTSLELTDQLAAMGLGSLSAPAGDLDGVFEGAFVSAVAQGATITVAEKGTVAAAVTAIGLAGSAAPDVPEIELRLDHQFEFQVVEQQTGLVLFAGRVEDPSATS
jgi:serine protease inhibitor